VEKLEADYERFFFDSKRALVGQAYLLCGELEEAQDLAQEALIRAWRHWERVRALDDPYGWTRKVLHNLAVSQWRRRRIRLFHADLTLTHVPEPDVEVMEIAAVISRLPEKQKRALVLSAIVGLTNSEIAEELKSPEGTIRVWLSRARAAVAEELRGPQTYKERKPGARSR
jgi:RNA polymerase sigma-70 factor (ECF subfamily)